MEPCQDRSGVYMDLLRTCVSESVLVFGTILSEKLKDTKNTYNTSSIHHSFL